MPVGLVDGFEVSDGSILFDGLENFDGFEDVDGSSDLHVPWRSKLEYSMLWSVLLCVGNNTRYS